jgi:hypothetical protein
MDGSDADMEVGIHTVCEFCKAKLDGEISARMPKSQLEPVFHIYWE